MNCFRDSFGQFIKFFVPFIIIGLVTPAIADTGRTAGRTLLVTMGIAYASTLFAGYFAYGISCGIFPSIMSGGLKEAATRAFPAYFALKIPPLMDVTTALATSFMLSASSSTWLTSSFGLIPCCESLPKQGWRAEMNSALSWVSSSSLLYSLGTFPQTFI